jgi:catechol 2,3-dioxygenase-like lactoylglutathione lyase family enzyme
MTIVTTGRIHLVMVPTTDPDRSIAFYEALGFAKRADFPFGEGGGRWVELFPAEGSCGVALSGLAEREAVGVDTGLIVTVAAALEAAHAALRDAGVDVDAEIARPGGDVSVRVGSVDVVGPTPALFAVRDPDGNRLLLIGE